jgi:hypothetical protein
VSFVIAAETFEEQLITKRGSPDRSIPAFGGDPNVTVVLVLSREDITVGAGTSTHPPLSDTAGILIAGTISDEKLILEGACSLQTLPTKEIAPLLVIVCHTGVDGESSCCCCCW